MSSVITDFSRDFSRLKHRDIILYGIGFQTQTICRELQGYRIIGLMDNNPSSVGKEVCGRPVLADNEAVASGAVIVIVSKPENQQRIYGEISYMEERGCELYFQNGQRASVSAEVFDPEGVTKLDHDLLTRMIDSNKVISFDLFGTLIERQVSRPSGIFLLMQRSLADEGHVVDFAFDRMQAESSCMIRAPYCFQLADVYRELGSNSRLSEGELKGTMDLEVKLEAEYVVPKNSLLDAYYYALDQGKKVNIISDMYLPSDALETLLDKVGVSGYERLIVSAEAGGAKQDGSLWKKYAKAYDVSQCLHVGDNQTADDSEARKLGISTFPIKNSFDLMLETPLNRVLASPASPESAVIGGLVCNRLFASPFGRSGRPLFGDCSDLGYGFFGPIIFDYLVRLYRHSSSSGANKIFFLAREGYLLTALFSEMLQHIDRPAELNPIYFKTSRRMAINSSILEEQDIYDSLESVRFFGTFRELLINRFGVQVAESDVHKDLIANTKENLVDIKTWLARYVDDILRQSAKERAGFLAYIDSVYAPTDQALFSDVGSNGTIQYHINKIIQRPVSGFYFSANTGASNPYGQENIHGVHSTSSEFFRALYLFESVVTGPEGMYISCDGPSSFLNGPKMANQVEFAVRDEFHRGIREFVVDMISLDPRFVEREYDSELTDRLFGVLPEIYPCIPEEIRSTFYYDNYLTRTEENLIKP